MAVERSQEGSECFDQAEKGKGHPESKKKHGCVDRMLKRLGVVWGMRRLMVWLEDSVLGEKGRG